MLSQQAALLLQKLQNLQKQNGSLFTGNANKNARKIADLSTAAASTLAQLGLLQDQEDNDSSSVDSSPTDSLNDVTFDDAEAEPAPQPIVRAEAASSVTVLSLATKAVGDTQGSFQSDVNNSDDDDDDDENIQDLVAQSRQRMQVSQREM